MRAYICGCGACIIDYQRAVGAFCRACKKVTNKILKKLRF